ncbi:MAG: hypothetical protein JXB07_01660 [Anaerolineae bacterium]|nr:hypothetical protein [Anaerolineae bacterium]
MSTYTIKKLPDAPVVVITVTEDYDPSKDVMEAVEEVNRLLDTLDEQIFFIQDLTNIKVDFEDIMVAADSTGRGSEAPFHHVNIREIITVTANPLLRQVFGGMDSEVYGNVRTIVVDTLEEAMAYARSK